MVDIWGSFKGTADALGGAVTAPAGAMVDLAQMPFDDKDDDFGSVVSSLADRTGDFISPVVSPQSMLGLGGMSKLLEGANWTWREGVSEPVATGNTMVHHTLGVPTWSLMAGPMALAYGGVFGDHHYGDAIDGDSWAKAYQQANQQENSAGSTLAWGVLNPGTDPLSVENPYQTVTEEHGSVASGLAWTGEIGASFVADPTFLGLKGVGAVRNAVQYRKMSVPERANLYDIITSGSKTGRLKSSAQSRTDKYLDWINGADASGAPTNSVSRPLSAPEILYGSPELSRYAKDPQGVAGFLADAQKIESPAERRNVQRRILAVAAGDESQVARLRTENLEAASLADQLSNMVRGGVMDLDALGVAPTLANNPIFRLRLENQFKNLNSRGDVDKFIDDFTSYNDRLLETHKTLPNLPGVHQQGKRAVNRLNDQGVARLPKKAQEHTLDAWSASLAAKAQSTSSVFQKGKYTVPLVAVKTVGLAASVYTKAPVAASDALRQTHFSGVASLHDWGSATTQLDSMMRIGGVDFAERSSLLNKAFIAGTESDKQKIIEQVEHASVQGLMRFAGERSGRAIDDDYITELMSRGTAKRNSSLSSLQGRVYAATEAQGDDALKRMGGESGGKWRLDQINDDGTPLALPVFETQLGNFVPLFDIAQARHLVKRDTGYLSRLSTSWKAESKEIERLSGLKAAGATGLDRAIQSRAAARDWLVDAGQLALRGWKFSVLFRLGYPIRVLTDDHLRIWSKIGAGSFYGPNLREFGGNLKYNTLDRKVIANREMHDLKVRRRQVLDELDGNDMMVHGARAGDLASVEASLKGHQRSAASLRKQIEEAETKKSLGLTVDVAPLREKLKVAEGAIAEKEAARTYLHEQIGTYGPTELKRELDDIDARIEAGVKTLRGDKRSVGTADVSLGDGATIPGAFAGEYGSIMKSASGSGHTYEALLDGAESRSYRAVSGGSHRTVQASEPGHLDAWADVLNNQILTSDVGKYFLNGGDVAGFAKWIREPAQAGLRKRVSHFAYDPEDWGGRAFGIVHDYVPNEAVRAALLEGRVSSQKLGKLVSIDQRPAVHGRVAADNLGNSGAIQSIGNGLNRLFRALGETPTDVLSRHPYFNSLYQQHAQEFYAIRQAGKNAGKWGPEDAAEISLQARKAALKDLKSTLFDLSAHSHAAHVMRFISPFFGAHQEGVARWWRIAADKPHIVRRLTQAMDLPRQLQIEVDENGDLVEPGTPISSKNRILLQVPKAFGGPDATEFQSKWTISESAFNIILQGGLTNPGSGPLVTVPMDWAAQKYADDPAIARVARIFNPYPANSPGENIFPATGKRLSAYIYGKTGVDPSLGLGIGKREYNAAFSQTVQDKMVTFQLENGREPNRQESKKLVDEAGTEATTQMFHRLLWNGLSPTPASPRSKYAIFQQGWYKIQEQSKAEGKDFDWAYEQFKEKYGAAYLPLIYSTSNNPGWVDASPADVGAIKHYKPVLKSVDPALTRMVIGAYAGDMIEKNATLGEYSPDARNFLRDQQIKPGSDATYYSYDNPATAVDEQMARRGWAKYGELTGTLTNMALEQGLKSYEDSETLVALKRAGVEQISAENYAFRDEYGQVDSEKYNRYIEDMKTIASSPVLANDAERTDIKVLQAYLALHDLFNEAIERRQAAGLGGPDAESTIPMRQAYTALVDQLVESNTYFQQYHYDGAIERDPLLYREAS